MDKYEVWVDFVPSLLDLLLFFFVKMKVNIYIICNHLCLFPYKHINTNLSNHDKWPMVNTNI